MRHKMVMQATIICAALRDVFSAITADPDTEPGAGEMGAVLFIADIAAVDREAFDKYLDDCIASRAAVDKARAKIQ